MNTTLEQIKAHRSIRAFTTQSIAEDVIKEIIKAAQQAPSSSYNFV